MLEAQIAQKASFSSTPPDKLLTKPRTNPWEHCSCVILKEKVEDFTDSKDIQIVEGRKIIMAGSKEGNNGGKTATFIENDTVEIPTIFPPKILDTGSFSIPCIVGNVKIERALCDLGTSVSIMPYSLFHKLPLWLLQAALFPLQLADNSEMQPIGRLGNVSVNIGYWLLHWCKKGTDNFWGGRALCCVLSYEGKSGLS